MYILSNFFKRRFFLFGICLLKNFKLCFILGLLSGSPSLEDNMNNMLAGGSPQASLSNLIPGNPHHASLPTSRHNSILGDFDRYRIFLNFNKILVYYYNLKNLFFFYLTYDISFGRFTKWQAITGYNPPFTNFYSMNCNIGKDQSQSKTFK